jgi:hypothetical protein
MRDLGVSLLSPGTYDRRQFRQSARHNTFASSPRFTEAANVAGESLVDRDVTNGHRDDQQGAHKCRGTGGGHVKDTASSIDRKPQQKSDRHLEPY